MVVKNESVVTKDDLESLYDISFMPVARWISRAGGSWEDARDIFHDALLAFHERKAAGRLNLNGEARAYILGIAKHLWFRKYRQSTEHPDFNELRQQISDPETELHPQQGKILEVLSRTGRKCMELLTAFYFEQMPLSKITNAFGFSSPHSATEQKYKCMEKVRNFIKKKSLSYESFVD